MAESGRKKPGAKLIRDAIRVQQWVTDGLLPGSDQEDLSQLADRILERVGPSLIAQHTSRGRKELSVNWDAYDRFLKTAKEFLDNDQDVIMGNTNIGNQTAATAQLQPTVQDENDGDPAFNGPDYRKHERPGVQLKLTGPGVQLKLTAQGATEGSEDREDSPTRDVDDNQWHAPDMMEVYKVPQTPAAQSGESSGRRPRSEGGQRFGWEEVMQRTRPVGAASSVTSDSYQSAVLSSSPAPANHRMATRPARSEWWSSGNEWRPEGEPTGTQFGKYWNPATGGRDSPGDRARREASEEFDRVRRNSKRLSEHGCTPMSWQREVHSRPSTLHQPLPIQHRTFPFSPQFYNKYAQQAEQQYTSINQPDDYEQRYQQPAGFQSAFQHQAQQEDSRDFLQRFPPGRNMTGSDQDEIERPRTELDVLKERLAEMEETIRRLSEAQPRGVQNHGGAEERAEYAKPELVGLLNPIPAHQEWNGQATDDKGTYVSFTAWMTHLEAVLRQKNNNRWKDAVLDTATLQCLKGHALHWWNALSAAEQEQLRRDYTLNHWRDLGAKMTRRTYVGRKEALGRKRRPGETLVEYAYAKHEMLKDAFEDRRVEDLIMDIRDGLSTSDQLILRHDLGRRPSVQRLIDEFMRIDEIRAEEFRAAKKGRPLQSPRWNNQQNQYGNRGNGYGLTGQSQGPAYTVSTSNQNVGRNGARTPFQHEPKMIKMRPDPLNLNGKLIRTYEFKDGKVIYLRRACRHCGATDQHFDFECSKRAPVARAAVMTVEEPGYDEAEDSVDFYSATTDTAMSPDNYFQMGNDDDWEAFEGAWDESMGTCGSGN